jgi:hypothetical protein
MENYTTIALIVGLATLLVKVLENLARWFFGYLNKQGDNGKADNKQNISLAVLDNRLKMIEDNHLPHLEKRLDRVDEKLDKIYDLLIKK